MHDVLIIGGGPAGMAAAVYLARQKLRFVMLTEVLGGQALWSTDIENYLGFHLLDGASLVSRFQDHLKDYKDAFVLEEGSRVTSIQRIEGDAFQAITSRGTYDGKAVLIATGATHRKLNIPGEKELYGKGVTYCAACDAPLFRDKIVYVVGGGNSAMDAALFVVKYAARVIVVSINPTLAGDSVMLDKVRHEPRISVRESTKITGIHGKDRVNRVTLQSLDGSTYTETADGVMIEIGLVPASGMIDFVAKDKGGQIVVDKMNATNVDGIWAAGDVTDVTEKQIAVAVGEGSKAALSIIKHFQTHAF